MSSSTSGSTSTSANVVWRRFWASNGLIRTRRWTPRSGRSQPYARRPSTATVTLLRPACSPSCWSMISVAKRCRSAQRRYIRSSISAQSVASVPPAPALIVSSAGRSSYSPENNSVVRSRPKLGLEGRGVAFELGLELGVGCLVEQVDGGEEVVRPPEEALPQGDLLAQPVSLAKDLLCGALIVPEARLLGQLLELGDASVLGRKVKASPRSRGSARPGRGWRRRPPSSGPADPGAGSA